LRNSGAEVRRIADAARGMAVAFGMIEEADAAQFYNTCMVVRDGDILHIHRKLNLATYGGLEEGKYFAAGRYVDAFDLQETLWRLSVLVCADAWNPALVHLAALHGVTLLLVPTNSAEDVVSSEFSNPDGWDRATRFYGMIYGMPIVVANRVGKEAGLSFWGGSGIVDPYGNMIEQAPRNTETLICADIDYADVRRARVQLPTVRDSNLALVRREMARLESLIGVPSKVRKL
jgi:predicted amidohydrolase